MSSPPARPAGVLSTARIETLTDGVFAIVMTLLILEIHVPQIAEGLVDAESASLSWVYSGSATTTSSTSSSAPTALSSG
jgi:hypothetical protein